MKNFLKTRARQMRKEPTHAERLLWNILRNRKFHGHKFRRQYVIDGYIADFICLDQKLIIELDGPHHQKTADYDQKRDTLIQSKGFIVIRYKNEDFLNGFDRILEDMEFHLKPTILTPHPNPSPSGRGAFLSLGGGIRQEIFI